jgi:hypothetical protein
MTKEDKIAISCLFAFIAAGGIYFYYDLQTPWYKVKEFCKPRHFTGGFIKKNGKWGCINRYGNQIFMEDILIWEPHVK